MPEKFWYISIRVITVPKKRISFSEHYQQGACVLSMWHHTAWKHPSIDTNRYMLGKMGNSSMANDTEHLDKDLPHATDNTNKFSVNF
jgi:hypothetical protein